MRKQYSNFTLRSEFRYPIFVRLQSLSPQMLKQNKLPDKDKVSEFIKKNKTGTFLELPNSVADRTVERWTKKQNLVKK